MKKLFSILLSGLLCGSFVFGFAACKREEPDPVTTYTVYAPDGAPALALANLIDRVEALKTSTDPAKDELHFTFEAHVVQANEIVAHVSFEEDAKNADFCILPVNAAAKRLGSASTYQLLGSVTNGNMFFISKDGAELTADNLSTLVGKKVGVVQLANVPGLTFRSVLDKNDLSYKVLSSPNDEGDADKINLVPFADAKTVGPAAGCDYYLCPEPAASAKTNAGMRIVGDLQAMYGGGYPQAVAVAKCSVIESCPDAVSAVCLMLGGSESYLTSTEPAEIVKTLSSAYASESQPTFTEANLTAQVIANCSVRFTTAKNCKDKVNAFLAELIAVDPTFTSAVNDAFYYIAN